MQFAQTTQRSLPLFAAPAHDNVIALRPLAPVSPVSPVSPVTPVNLSNKRPTTSAQRPHAAAPRPLRLIVNRAADGSCKLVASGRLADVCAELNRLSLA